MLCISPIPMYLGSAFASSPDQIYFNELVKVCALLPDYQGNINNLVKAHKTFRPVLMQF
jgi:hypothetical protein